MANSNYPLGVSGSSDYFCEPDPPEEAYELTDVEKLIVAQAFYKAVADLIKTKKPDNLRGRVDAEFKALYESTGAKSFDLKLLGGKVGTYSIVVAKPTESETYVELDVVDEEAYTEWAKSRGYIIVDQKAVDEMFRQTGEIPPGCEPRTVVVPGTPGGGIRSTSLRVDEETVANALGPGFADVSELLLTGGIE